MRNVKKLFPFFLIFMFLVILVPVDVHGVSDAFHWGDVNFDGTVDFLDMGIINNYRLHGTEVTSAQFFAGDVNGDGNLDLDDINLINDYRYGNISAFPVEANYLCAGAFYNDDADIVWKIDFSGIMTFNGWGNIEFSNESSVPWKSYLSNIKSVSFEEDIRIIGSFSFAGCTELQSVTIPQSVSMIGESSFYQCKKLSSVYYSGRPQDWTSISIGENNIALDSATKYYFYGCKSFDPADISWNKPASGFAEIKVAGTKIFFSFIPTQTATYLFSSTEVPGAAHGYIFDSNGNFIASAHGESSTDNFSVHGRLIAGGKYFFCITLTDNNHRTGLVKVALSKFYPVITIPEDCVDFSNSSDLDKGDIAYYSFSPKVDGDYIFESTNDSGDAYGHLFVDQYSQIQSDDDSGSGFNFRIRCSLYSDLSYKFGARWYNNDYGGNLQIRLRRLFHVHFDTCWNGILSESIDVLNGDNYGELPIPSETISNYRFDGWFTSASGGTQVTSSTTVNLSENQTLYAHWSLNSRNFNVITDAYPFANNMTAFGYTSRGPGATYPIQYEPAFQLIFGDTVAGKSKYRQTILEKWGGNCCGMSSSTALFFSDNGINSTDYGKETVASLGINDTNQEISILTFVEAMQVAQYTDSFAKEYKGNKLYKYQIEAGYSLDNLYNTVSNSLREGEGTIIGIGKQGIGAHALLAYRIENVTASEVRMYVYDCNFPKESRYFTLKKDTQGAITSWTYNMGDEYGIWGTEGTDGYMCFISYIPFDTIKYIWDNKGNLYDNKEVLSVNADNLSIKDFYGTEVAKIVNGQLKTTRDDIYEIPDLSMNWSSTTSLYLPKDYYTLSTTDETELEASMVDLNLGATVRTTSGTVSFAVDDSTRENTVIIENASTRDSYTVSLESSFQNVRYENVTVSGTGRGDSISISGDRDSLSIINCNIDSMLINGTEQVTHVITAYAGQGGSITPEGDTRVTANGEQKFIFTANPGYAVESVKVNGVEIGAVSEYTFKNVIKDHTIAVYFKKTFEITNATFNNASHIMEVKLINASSAMIIAGLYTENGKMVGVVMESVTANKGKASLDFSEVEVPAKCTAKIILVNSNYIPVCKSFEITK